MEAQTAQTKTKDYTNAALAEYIRDNPEEALQDMKLRKLVPKRRIPIRHSQQWRLGHNGPGTLKRLGRLGPLRPVYHGMNQRSNNGLPRLVLKRYNYLPQNSVFHRLGWNPLYTIARHRVQQARHYLWRRRFNYQPRGRVVSLPWGRRTMFWRPHWMQRQMHPFQMHRHQMHPHQMNTHQMRPPHQMQQGQTNTGQMHHNCFVSTDFRNQQMIRRERMRIQNRKLQELGTFNNQADHQPATNPFMTPATPHLPDASASQYPIARDEYMPPRPVRAPSPEGSIISALSRPYSGHNPFARPAGQPAVNPFAPRAQTIQAIQANYNNGYHSAAFRPTPATTIPFNTRFTSSNMAMTVE